MRNIRIDKVTINIGIGSSGNKLDMSKRLLEEMTGKKAVITKTKKRNTFGVSKGRDIGTKVTLRNEDAKEFLEKALKAVDNKLNPKQFSSSNFSFGIKEYIDIHGVKYIPELGIIGMDVCVTLGRPGFRINKRRIKRSKIGEKHKINQEESIQFIKNLGIKIDDNDEA